MSARCWQNQGTPGLDGTGQRRPARSQPLSTTGTPGTTARQARRQAGKQAGREAGRQAGQWVGQQAGSAGNTTNWQVHCGFTEVLAPDHASSIHAELCRAHVCPVQPPDHVTGSTRRPIAQPLLHTFMSSSTILMVSTMVFLVGLNAFAK
jgi:hypothetical protein